MNKRVRWFLLSPLSRTTLARAVEGMRSEEFTSDSTSGFIGERTRSSFVEARYVERSERTESIIDPFGNTQEFRRIEYQQTPFRLSLDAPQLEIYDGPRSVAPLLNRLSSLMGANSTVEPIIVDILKWLKHLQTEVSEICVTAAYISRLSLSESVSARIIINGTDDVRKYVKVVVGDKPFRFERLDVSSNFQGSLTRFDLREEGRATVANGCDEFLSALRKSLSSSLRPVN